MSTPFSDLDVSHNKHSSLETSYLKWISRQMEKRIPEYSETKQLSVFCGTWNVNARELPESCDLNEWIFPPGLDLCDIYVIGLQEMVDLNVLNVMLNSRTSDDMAVYWVDKLTKLLNGSKSQYSVVIEKHMVGVEFIIFAKEELAAHISDVRSSIVFTGGRGLTGNKGGIAVRMDIMDSSVCFVCSHFHADRDNVATRNLDFQTILDTASLTPNATPSNSVKSDDENTFSKHHNVTLSILNHEQVFWLGDLNYRIDELETQEVFDRVEASEWEYLRSKDQLIIEKGKNNIFQGFEEGPLTFPPTYKYQPGTDLYERRPDKKLRAPAWCDRVLWRSADKTAISLIKYQRAPLNASDHKPVSASFNSNIRKIIPEKMKAVYQDLLFSVDKWINASAPKIAVDDRIIDAGLVKCKEKYKYKIIVRNIGSVMAEWSFVPKNDELLVCKPWIKLYPSDGILAPNESSEIEVTIDLTTELAYEVLNTPKDSDNDKLEDIFVLHATKGSDFFCMISGKIDPQSITEVKRSDYAISRKMYEAQTVFLKKDSAVDVLNPAARKKVSSTPAVAPVVQHDHDTGFDSIYGKDDQGNF